MAKEGTISASIVNDYAENAQPRMTRKKILAFFLMSLMVLSAIAIGVPAMLDISGDAQDASATSWNPNPNPAGRREAVYKFDHWGENYLKNEKWNYTNYATDGKINGLSLDLLGHHGKFLSMSTRRSGNPTGMGVSDWLNGSGCPRDAGYGEKAIRSDKYPYIFANNPNSAETTGVEAELDYVIWTPYRMTGTIKNESQCRVGWGGPASMTSPLHDFGRAWFVPKLGNGQVTTTGASINASFYGTYLTGPEVTRIKAPRVPQGDVHYAQWFYGCSASFLSGTNDGYFYELQGWINYSRASAVGYLGYTDASGDIRTWFAGAQAAITTAWINDWKANGSSETGVAQQNGTRGRFSMYNNYEYNMNNSGMLNIQLKIDTRNSTYRTIAIRFYSISWGGESLLMRLMERCNVTGATGRIARTRDGAAGAPP